MLPVEPPSFVSKRTRVQPNFQPDMTSPFVGWFWHRNPPPPGLDTSLLYGGPQLSHQNQMLTANYKSLTSNSNRLHQSNSNRSQQITNHSHQIQIAHSKFKLLTVNYKLLTPVGVFGYLQPARWNSSKYICHTWSRYSRKFACGRWWAYATPAVRLWIVLCLFFAGRCFDPTLICVLKILSRFVVCLLLRIDSLWNLAPLYTLVSKHLSFSSEISAVNLIVCSFYKQFVDLAYLGF